MMASKPTSNYRPRTEITPEQARDIRARALAFIFECYQTKRNKAAGISGGEKDAKGPEDDRAISRLPRSRH